jgi:hypothetical protein
LYQSTAKDSLPRKLVAELEKVVETGKMVEVVPLDSQIRRLQEVKMVQGSIEFNELLGKLAEMPFFSDLMNQLSYLTGLKPAALQEQVLEQPIISTVISDMRIDAIVSEA